MHHKIYVRPSTSFLSHAPLEGVDNFANQARSLQISICRDQMYFILVDLAGPFSQWTLLMNRAFCMPLGSCLRP